MAGAELRLTNVCKPLDSLSEVNDFIKNPPGWGGNTITLNKRSKVIKNSDLYDNGSICHFNKLTKVPARFEYGSVPKTLICHDMANGYHDDRFILGTDNYSAYCFYHWGAIDMFIYFSHHFITIPPLGWINAAHKHGVQILGTIITEWNDGKATCEQFLANKEEMERFADQLVTIAKYLKMDGWLINIENKIDNVDMLLKFVKYLTATMHEEIPGSVVIWYDSVIKDGSLSWQNCLNEKNMDFFNVCDGLFTNYCWGRSHLERSVIEAGARKHDVYVGVDVWGRNFWGGGLFNTAEAVMEVHNVGLSLAIFAPAWTHEGIQSIQVMDQQYNQSDPDHPQSCSSKALDETASGGNNLSPSQRFRQCAVREHFILRENAFWNTLWPYLNTRGPSQLPFQTFFCLGSGEKKWMNGEVIEDRTWFNLQQQDYQLSSPICANGHWLTFESPEIQKPKAATPPKEPHDKTLNVMKDTDGVQRQKRMCDSTNYSDKHVSDVKIPNRDLEKDVNVLETTDLAFDKLPVNSTHCDTICPTDTSNQTDLKELQENTIIKSETTCVEVKQFRPLVKKFMVKLKRDKINCVEFYHDDSLEGGGCFKISPVNNTKSPEISRLFICELLCDHNFTVYYAVKELDVARNQDLHLIFSLRNNRTREIFHVVLTSGQYVPKSLPGQNVSIVLRPVNANSKSFNTLQQNLLMTHPGFYIPVENDNKWDVRYFSLEYPNCTILEVWCKLKNKSGRMLLGALGIAKDVVNF